ncbi:DUF1553 domain-containing protein [Roseibacillus persicicus]|uniref:DUF1553 domain-containing protein n=1 Tax=Roseibacillus persicicus TaxID=454148 RepID=UPI00398A8567
MRLFTLPLVLLITPTLSGQEKAPIDFNDQVQPILSEYCYHCHGPDSSTRLPNADKGGQPLRLDREADAFEVREDLGEPVILKGDPENSELILRLISDDKTEIMPPPKAHKTMKEEEIEILKQWVAEGAPYEEHWSFIAPSRPALPEVNTESREWSQNPIDTFIAAEHEKRGLTANPREEDARLLRRLSLDLSGLPPTPEQLDNWKNDPNAAVESLLGTDEYAEHFGRHWLDAARYADTHGIHIDNYRAIWPYRDWVIDAFRKNMPFDQFTREQIAGDMMPNPTTEQMIASGFNRCLATTGEGGAIAEEWEAIYAQERVDTLSAVWLGLSTGCAACHDHKFDPITQVDNFSLTAFFRNTTMAALDKNNAEHPPNLFVTALEDRGRWEEVQAAYQAKKKEAEDRLTSVESDFASWAEQLRAEGPAADEVAAKVDSSQGLIFNLPLDAKGPTIDGLVQGQMKNWPAPNRKFVDGPLGPATWVNDSGVSLGDVGGMDAKGQFSYGMLIYTEGKANGPVIAKMDEQRKFRGWDFWMQDGRLASHLIDEWTNKAHKIVSKEVLEPKKWHHVMVTYDGSQKPGSRVKMYLNGKLTASSTSPNSAADSFVTGQPLRLGARSHGQKLSGGQAAIQDFRIYDRILPEAELQQLAELVDYVPLEVAATVPLDKMTERQRRTLKTYFLTNHDEPYQTLQRELAELEKEMARIRARGSVTLVMDDRKDQEAYAHVLTRGDYRQKAQKVPAAVPEILPQLPSGVRADRLALADWLVSPENPLPARVTVNRLWYYFFGTGIVETTEDFGIMGARPSHPQLLDWLAVEFVESGWDLQHMIRLIVSSATYQQSGRTTPEQLESDPDNRYLSRGPRYRLDAEQIRDLALSASGLLVKKFGGPSVKPYQPKGVWSAVAMNQSNTRYYKEDSGEALYRRSLYTFWKRTAPPASMDLFDAPSRETFCVRRSRTNTPLQAFVLMNDPQFVEASRRLAENAMKEETDFEGRVRFIYKSLLAREAGEKELVILKESFQPIEAGFQQDPARASELIGVGASKADPNLNPSELATWTVLASQVLNLDETITK